MRTPHAPGMPLRAWLLAVLLTVAGLGVMPSAHAHKPSDSYLTLQADGSRIDVRWDIALRDLDFALDLDVDRDERVTWGEVRMRHADIAALALRALALSANDATCTPQTVSHALDRHSDGTYAVLRFVAACPAEVGQIGVSYRLFADLDPTHRGIVRAQASGGAPRTLVLAPDGAAATLNLAADGSALAGFSTFVASGVHHILIGWDHLAFLLALLLPAVFRREDGRWVPSNSLGASVAETVRIVTAFTIAHSITLALAALQWVSLPPRLVEAAIAASVAVAALNNVVPLMRQRLWQMAFGFGLVHGFGFASALADAGLQGTSIALGLLGFNLGVELGQLGVVAIVLPLCWWLRSTRFYIRAAVPALSMLLVAAGIVWFVERAFELNLLPA